MEQRKRLSFHSRSVCVRLYNVCINILNYTRRVLYTAAACPTAQGLSSSLRDIRRNIIVRSTKIKYKISSQIPRANFGR